jgi:hypothetical protein
VVRRIALIGGPLNDDAPDLTGAKIRGQKLRLRRWLADTPTSAMPVAS